jgi:uncharacterized membrane protein
VIESPERQGTPPPSAIRPQAKQRGPTSGDEAGVEWRDLIAIFLLAVLGVAVTGLPPVARVPFGVLAVLLAPGYALIAAMFPTDEQVDFIERLGLALATSFALVAIEALVLDKLPGGLSFGSIRLGVVTVTVVFAIAAVFRRIRSREAPIWRRGSGPNRGPRRAVRFTQTIVVVNLLVAAFAFILALGGRDVTPTEFYVLGASEQLGRYPREVAAGQPLQLRAGVNQSTAQAGRYQITVKSGERVLASAGPISLGAGGQWQEELTIQPPDRGDEREVTLYLEPAGGGEPLRTLRLWVNVRTPGQA